MEKIEPNSGIHYWTSHDDAPLTMVLIHGFTGSHEGFQYIEPLLPHIRFIMPDLPGFGISLLPPQNEWSIDQLAASLNTFVENLQLKTPPIILGHSMGGLVVASMVQQAPALYDKKTILIAPVPAAIMRHDSRKIGARLGEFQYYFGYATPKVGAGIVKSKLLSYIVTQMMLTTDDKALRRAIRKHHLKNLTYLATPEHMRYYEAIEKDINRRGAIDYANGLRKKQCLLIAGTRDTVAPLVLEKELGVAIHAKLVTIDSVNHLMHYERPTEITQAIEQFVVADEKKQ